MNGTDPGIDDGREDLPVRRAERARRAQQVASIARTPPIVLTSTGKKALMNTMNTFDHMPMPNQIRIERDQRDARRRVERGQERLDEHRAAAGTSR